MSDTFIVMLATCIAVIIAETIRIVYMIWRDKRSGMYDDVFTGISTQDRIRLLFKLFEAQETRLNELEEKIDNKGADK